MSQNSPDPHETLHVITHAAYILKSPSNFSETVILFSINDGEWMAWYTYRELVSKKRARDEFDDNLNGDHRISLVGDWKVLNSKTFKPSKPRRVDEFAPADGGYARALLLKPLLHSGNFLTMNGHSHLLRDLYGLLANTRHRLYLSYQT